MTYHARLNTTKVCDVVVLLYLVLLRHHQDCSLLRDCDENNTGPHHCQEGNSVGTIQIACNSRKTFEDMELKFTADLKY